RRAARHGDRGRRRWRVVSARRRRHDVRALAPDGSSGRRRHGHRLPDELDAADHRSACHCVRRIPHLVPGGRRVHHPPHQPPAPPLAANPGELLMLPGATMVMERCTCSNNPANTNGTVYMSSGTAQVTNCTFFNNEGGGGAIVVNNASAVFAHNTIVNNIATV